MQLTASQEAANYESMQFGSDQGGIVCEQLDDKRLKDSLSGLSSLETMQSSMTSQNALQDSP